MRFLIQGGWRRPPRNKQLPKKHPNLIEQKHKLTSVTTREFPKVEWKRFKKKSAKIAKK